MSLNPKFITAKEAAALIPDGASIMLSGFVGCGSALQVIDELSKTDVKDLRLIMNDSSKQNGPDGDEFYSWAKLIHNGQVDGYLGSHLGTNREAQEMQNDGRLNVDLVPQGSLVEESPFCLGRQTIEGKDYLLMKPVTADWAIVKGAKVDKVGNVWYKGTGRNFAPYMAAAAKHVIVEAEQVVEVGEILPEDVVTPGILVDYIVEVQK